MVRPIIAVVAMTMSTIATAQWQELGPAGGPLSDIAAVGARVFAYSAAGGNRLFRSDDTGLHWRELGTPNGCGPQLNPYRAIQVRSNGQVFLHCDPIMRSVDGGETWSVFGQPRFTGELAFHPTIPARAALAGTSYNTRFVNVTIDDGTTWEWQFAEGGAFKPFLISYDPIRDDRMFGVGSQPYYVQTPSGQVSVYPLNSYESFDNGYSWKVSGTLAAGTPEVSCYERAFAFEASGRQYTNSDCGFFRSPDGRQWERVPTFPASGQSALMVDPSRDGRVLTYGFGTTFESRDAGATWHRVADTPGLLRRMDVSGNGDILAATDDGFFVGDATLSTWTKRVEGLYGNPRSQVEPSDGGTILTALAARGSTGGHLRSSDGGKTWESLVAPAATFIELSRNATESEAFLAIGNDQTLFSSADGTTTWQPIPPDPTLPAGIRISGVMAVGPQPGVVWALYSICVTSGFGGCFYRPQGVVRSVDGGRHWGPLALIESSVAATVVPSPADAAVAMAAMQSGVHVTRDAGLTWQPVLPVAMGRVVADSLESGRWYALGLGGIAATSDYGRTWFPLADPLMASRDFDLLVDPRQPWRLVAVGANAEVSVSSDRGASWTRIVEPSALLKLASGSSRLGPETTRMTVYAAGVQGVLKLELPDKPGVTYAVEYWNEHLQHYFLTADAAEQSLLDSHYFSGWIRTGQSFEVFPPATQPTSGASPVCRYYGRPERGLDTHFYSASPAECQAVRDLFGDDWILESTSAFAVHLPDTASGQCPVGTAPVYRVLNGRADVNHRYTTSQALRADMIGKGWIPEGYGPVGVAMCSP